MPPCSECGVVLDFSGKKWYVGGSSGRICSTCHSHESQWPRNITASAVQDDPYFKRGLAGMNDVLPAAALNPNCGHLCKRMATPYTFCCVCGGASGYDRCSICAPKMIAKSLQGNGLPGDQAVQIERMILLKGIDGSSAKVSASTNRARETRLRMSSVKGYHQTCEIFARLIDSSQMFKPGSTGLAGGGIYMAVRESDTHHKAHHYGVLYTCDVLIGNTKLIPMSGDRSITFATLLGEGYDSVRIPRPGGDEYVVYNPDQVTNIARVRGFVPIKFHCIDPHPAAAPSSSGAAGSGPGPALPKCNRRCSRPVRFGRDPKTAKFWKTCCEPCGRGRGGHDATCKQ